MNPTFINKTIWIPAIILFFTFNACNPTSEQKMMAVIKRVKQKFYNSENSFSVDAKIAYCDSMIAVTGKNNMRLLLKLNYMKANALLEYGESKKASEIFESLLKNPEVIANKTRLKLVQGDLAVAYLRVGEQANCILNHSADACVFPIRGGGIHKNQSGSRDAIEVYKKILADDPEDMESRWLLNIAYMTLDEYPENVPKAYLIPNLDAVDSTVKVPAFEDIASDVNLDTKDMAGGVILEDFDNDGYVDVVKSSWNINQPMHYFKNNADGTFTDLSEKSGLKKFTGGLNIMQTDYNNDGLKDIFVTRGAWLQGEFGEQPNSLLKNNGDGTFTDVTIESGLLSFHPTQTATWNDFNNDGWLDVFIGNESTTHGNDTHYCEFFINNKNGTFTDISSAANCNILDFVKGVTSGDYDNDGWKDIFISTMSGRRYLLKNKGIEKSGVKFEDVTHQAMLDKDYSRSFPTWFWDFDNDGWLDIFVGDYTFSKTLGYYAALDYLKQTGENTGQATLYRNNHNGTFSNITKESGLFKTAYAMGSNFGDIDNDGYLDMYLGTGNPSYKSLVPNKMFKNIEGKRFADVTTSAKVGNLQKGHGVAFADMDNDGDQDIYIEMGGAFIGDAYQNSFYRNTSTNNNTWISLNLEGVKSNKAAIGSRVKITFQEKGKTRTIYRDVNSGGSFGSSPLKREIGLGETSVIDEIEIKWHGSGNTSVFKNVEVNQLIKIKEGETTFEKINVKAFRFKKKANHKMTECVTM